MTFTYDLASTNEDLHNIALVRLELGDVTSGAGVRPDLSNLQDEEILVWLEAEADDIQRTVARACSALSKQWTNVANITVGPRKEELGKVAKEWADRAKEASPVDTSSFVVNIVRVDQKQDPYRNLPEDEGLE